MIVQNEPVTMQPGTVIGRLTLISKSVNHHGHTVWECLCECGSTCAKKASFIRAGKTRSCGCLRREMARNKQLGRTGAQSTNWHGGKIVTHYGYVEIHAPDHPYANKRGYVFEHRLVMEKQVGRYLTRQENVHHKNGLRADNRVENLELWSRAQPVGQRVEEKSGPVLYSLSAHDMRGL